MAQVLLSGGPQDGKRITLSGSVRTVNVAYIRRLPLPLPPDPRPSWWRHPVRWFRWKPSPPPPMPEAQQFSYRDTGRTDDGARVFEIDGNWQGYKGPEAGDGDLYRSLAAAYGAVHPMIRQDPQTRWVMSPAWYYQVRAKAYSRADPDRDDPSKWIPEPHDCLLGVPVTVADDGGAPHIENRRYPADF